MHETVDILVTIVRWGAVIWFIGLFGQVTDILNSLLDISFAKDSPARNRASRRRVTENIWVIVGGTVLVVVIAFGVDVAARLVFDENQPLHGVLLLLALVFLALVGGVGVVAGIIRGDGLSYAVLRANLIEDEGVRLKIEQVAEFRVQLEQIDGHKRHIRFGLRDRARLRPVRAKLAQVADGFGAVPPTGFGAVRAIRWKTANAYVWLGNPLRLIPAVVALLVVGVGIAAAVVADQWNGMTILLLVGALVASSASFLLAVVEARVALAGKAAWHAVYQKQRLEALRLIEELERASRKGVAGLGDRVAKALQILRDQQG